ncbi:MAG: hypothetical protein QOE09_2201 [Ilumatobacteraceae bacterium]
MSLEYVPGPARHNDLRFTLDQLHAASVACRNRNTVAVLHRVSLVLACAEGMAADAPRWGSWRKLDSAWFALYNAFPGASPRIIAVARERVQRGLEELTGDLLEAIRTEREAESILEGSM